MWYPITVKRTCKERDLRKGMAILTEEGQMASLRKPRTADTDSFWISRDRALESLSLDRRGMWVGGASGWGRRQAPKPGTRGSWDSRVYH